MDLIFRPDTLMVEKSKWWLNVSLGQSFTVQTDRLDIFVISTGLAFTHLNQNYRLIKVKTAYNHGFILFENFAQQTGELNFMTGKIKTISNRSRELYYGVGIITGIKRSGVISYPSAGGYFPSTTYARKDFIFIGIPFEYKLQWKGFGIGFDGNLNPYLPYIGAKLFVRIGNKYKK